nr:serine--tRNA synthetase-like protein Slimp [Osmia lignaria]
MAKYLSYFVNIYTIHNVAKHCALKHVRKISNCNRYYSSALLVPGDKRSETFVFLTPCLDFDNIVENTEKLQQELSGRGLNINADDVKKMWMFYKSVNADKIKLQARYEELIHKQKKFFGKTNLTAEEQIESIKLKEQTKVVKNDLKSVKSIISDLQETVLLKMLHLPNEVDRRTPLEAPVVLKHVNTLNEYSDSKLRKNHVEIGKELGLLEYKNPMQYYLCNEAALFELGVLSYAGKVFSANDMIRVAGADFSRSVVVEGSGLNHEDPSDAFIIDDHCDVNKGSSNRMHLVGGASLISFLAMHTKQLINPNHLPVSYFSTGRQYTPFRPGSASIGLFTVCQTSAAVAFVVVKDKNSEEYQTQFEKLFNTVSTLYGNICDHYQIVMRPASELRPWESMRVSFELWSSFSKQYIEVGHISACGDYFSKRLLIAYQTPTGRDFPSVISGTVLSVPRLLGCLLEQNPEKFIIPSKIREHMPDYISS